MKTLNFRTFALSLLVFSFPLMLAGGELKKNFHEEYSVGKESVLQLTNKFGKVNLVNWDKNQLVIDVTVTLEHPDAEKAQKLIELITVEFSTDGNIIKAETAIDPKFSKMNSGWGADKKKFSIDYEVKMPSYLNLDLSNKYGAVFADRLEGLVKLEVKYGSLKANTMKRGSGDEKNILVLGYSDCHIEEVNWLKVDIKYSDLTIKSAQVLGFISKYSDIFLTDVKSLVFESAYDDYIVDRVGTYKGESAYTGHKIGVLAGRLEMKAAYGSASVEKVSDAFELISFDGKYCKLKALIDPQVSYNLEANAEYAKVHVPESKNLSRVIESTKQRLWGKVGSNPDPKATVKISTRYGDAYLTK